MTAFRKSDRTGWSVHLAIPLGVYGRPLTHAAWVLAGAGAATALMTAAFVLLLRRELRAQRRDTLAQERAVRMEALGRMTGGVTHDFNNLLMIILGNLKMLGRRSYEPQLERYIAAIRKAAERGTHLTRELLTFSRGQGSKSEVVDLNERLVATLTMIRQSVSGHIDVRTDLVPGRHAVRLDPPQFDLALLNIAAYARDAMPDGGSLRITTRRAPCLTGLVARASRYRCATPAAASPRKPCRTYSSRSSRPRTSARAQASASARSTASPRPQVVRRTSRAGRDRAPP